MGFVMYVNRMKLNFADTYMQVVCIMTMWATALYQLSKVDYVIVLCNNAFLVSIRTASHRKGEMQPWLEQIFGRNWDALKVRLP